MPGPNVAVVLNDRKRRKAQEDHLKRALAAGKHTRDELLRELFADRLRDLVKSLKDDGEVFTWPPKTSGEYITYHLSDRETTEQAADINAKHKAQLTERRRIEWQNKQRSA